MKATATQIRAYLGHNVGTRRVRISRTDYWLYAGELSDLEQGNSIATNTKEGE